ncbi:MAG: CPBP family intramembrane metalloprotease [Anaerolineae bacterium]|nr:CPBP family intramembrane metalloprotease [Anaerolineae bacterium]
MLEIVKRHPIVTFFGLTYIFLILGWVIFNAQISYGPLLAALIVVPIISGRQGLKDWADQIIRWRVGVRWYVAALLLPLIATGTGALLAVLVGASATPIQLSALPELIPEAIFVLLVVGLGEEPGFRGFVIPQLQKRFSAITATLILAALGIVWHIPLIVTGDSSWTIVPVIAAGYFIFTWLFNNTNGSVLIAMLFHTAQAIFGPQIFGAMFSGAEVVTYTLLMSLVYGVIVAVIIAAARNRYLISTTSERPTTTAKPAGAVVGH